MTEVVGGTPTRTEPAPTASLTAISIKTSRRPADPATTTLSAGRKSGDLTRHLEREAAAAAAVVMQQQAVTLVSEPRSVEEPAITSEPTLASGEAELPQVTEESALATVEFNAGEAELLVPDDWLPEAPVGGNLPAHMHDLPHDAFADAAISEDMQPDTHYALPEDPALAAASDADANTPADLKPTAETADQPERTTEIAAEPAAPPVSIPPALSIVRTERPEPLPAAPTPLAASPVHHAPEFADIAGYWRSLCGDRVYPSTSAVDRELVSKRWPGTLMISFARTPGVRDPSIGGVARLGAASTAMQEAIDSGSYAIEWMIEVGRAALAASAPLEELQRLPTRAGTIAFRLLALPLGAPHAEPDSVLCHLAPAAAAPRFGKRRNWLAA